ncbi:sigma-70 family RNA polymerase sigma factor [Nocardia sp. BSTN01]|uniref:sigma-70 family RNA polymerase sigma factor n=1 Tax=Nocardia sp. BSTN01 TaxID=2783665 RepID=UPI00188E8E5B|nr:sigma-70 family RNA polymerase sigma factor [Nocardia sp. BSTN01]MBF5001524.1 sigma-70 family RNA polymerase sigma factor [Nocardia sp. BSTN01]
MSPLHPDEVTAQFLDHHELLFSVVYNMLGSVSDTEDVLQEVWLAWAARCRGADAAPVENRRAYLIRIAANKALARRAELSRSRETYVGPWLPEPLLAGTEDASDSIERVQSLSTAVLVVLETVSPLERAVFVLHEVFGFSHPEIGDMIGRRPEAVRQLSSRARKHVQARRPRRRVAPEVGLEVAERFVAAAVGGDMEALFQLLAPDVTLWTDSGGVGPAYSLQPVRGRDAVLAAFAAITANYRHEMSVQYRSVSGDGCALVFSGGIPVAAVVFDLSPDRSEIAGIYSVTNPSKITGAAEPYPGGVDDDPRHR